MKEIGSEKGIRQEPGRKFVQIPAHGSRFNGAHKKHSHTIANAKYRPAVCRDLCRDSPAKSETPPNNFPTKLKTSSKLNNHKNNKKRAFHRRLWRYFKRINGKFERPAKAQEAWRRRSDYAQLKMAFRVYKKEAGVRISKIHKTHKNKGHRLPYGTSLKVGTLNIRGLNGENGITKRQHITKVMKDERLDIILLTETQVNTSSVENHNDFIFFFSSDIQPGRSDREHAGVGIVIHRRMKPFIYEVKQISGRVMAIRLKSLGTNIAFICGYAPHSGHLSVTKEDFYDLLQNACNEIPELVFIGGDFNARLQYRYNNEYETMGPHMFGRGREYLEGVSQSTKENRDLFVDFCAANSFRVLNTDFQKPPAKQATFRENTTDIGSHFAPNTHAQIDFWLARQKHKNCCTDVQSRTDLYLNTDHYLVEMNIRLKLAGSYQSQDHPPKFVKPTPTQWKDYNVAVSRLIASSRTGDADIWKAFNESVKTAAAECLSRERQIKKHGYLSSTTWELIDFRQTCYLQGNHSEVKALDKRIKKEARADRKSHIVNHFQTQPGDPHKKRLWKTVDNLKKNYKPSYIKLKDPQGRLVPLQKRAETFATYLQDEHWFNTTGRDPLPIQSQIGDTAVCDSAQFTTTELKDVLRKIKIGKQPGPDQIFVELYKWLDSNNREKLLSILNHWWVHGHVPSEICEARVVPIYKQGGIDSPSNYRPISLLNSLYKIFVSLVRTRIQKAVDPKLASTQFGFRPKRSTAHATFIVRRLQDWSEQKGTDLFITLLDWEKAFDKVQHDKLFDAMRRLGLSEHFVSVVASLYQSPRFFVQDQYGKSEVKTQSSGIRQGCPLSPYLFLLVMTCVDFDVKFRCSAYVLNSRIPGVDFDAVYYADDTILFSTSPRGLNEILKHMEICSGHYGLKLNRAKCHTLNMHRDAHIHFGDGTILDKAQDATYLGNNLNHTVDLKREISQRIQDAMTTWRRLAIFWKASNISKKWQLVVYDAVIKGKLLYNLETVSLTQSLRKKLEAFQLRGLRQILKIPTTFVDRRWTNTKVFELASQTAYPLDPNRKVRPITIDLDERRVRLAGHILRAPNCDPLRQVSYEPNSAEPKHIGKRRVGRPRQQWVFKSNEDIHALHSHTQYEADPFQNDAILRAANNRAI